MKILFSGPNLIEIHHLRDFLEREGIETMLNNESSFSFRPEGFIGEGMPELWLLDDDKLVQALELKEEWKAGRALES